MTKKTANAVSTPAIETAAEGKARHLRDKIARESKPLDDYRDDLNAVYSLLSNVDELPDVILVEGFDGEEDDPADYTDRDDRFNRGWRYADALTAKLRVYEPTVEVTFDINEYDEDTFYLKYGGFSDGKRWGIYHMPLPLDGIETTFRHLQRERVGYPEATPENDEQHEMTDDELAAMLNRMGIDDESESKARINDFSDKMTRICELLETLEEICADFDDDNIDFAEDEDIAFHNLLCVQHVKDAMKDLYEMGAWYDEQIETAGLLLKAE